MPVSASSRRSRGLDQPQQDVLDVLATYRLGQRRGVAMANGTSSIRRGSAPGRSCRTVGRAADVGLASSTSPPGRPPVVSPAWTACSGCRRPPTAPSSRRPGRSRTGRGSVDLPRLGSSDHRARRSRPAPLDDLVAQVDALVADVHAGPAISFLTCFCSSHRRSIEQVTLTDACHGVDLLRLDAGRRPAGRKSPQLKKVRFRGWNGAGKRRDALRASAAPVPDGR